jgi:G3E family GTPase
MRPVVDLLVEQVECADFVLLNKVDLLPGGTEGEALEQLSAIVSSLNPLATVIACEQAKVTQLLSGLVSAGVSCSVETFR